MCSQRGAEEDKYDGQERSREREAEEEGDNRRLCLGASKPLACSIVRKKCDQGGGHEIVTYGDPGPNRCRL